MPAADGRQGGNAGFGRPLLQPMQDGSSGPNPLWLGGGLLFGLFLLYLVYELICRRSGGRRAPHPAPPQTARSAPVSNALVVRQPPPAHGLAPPAPRPVSQPPGASPVRGASGSAIRPRPFDPRTLTIPPWVAAALQRFNSTSVPFPFPVAAGHLPLAQRSSLPAADVIARLLVGSLADVDLGAFLTDYLQARVRGLTVLLPGSPTQAMQGLAIFDTGLQQMIGFYGALLPPQGECPTSQQAQDFRRLRDAARSSGFGLLSFADEINAVATEIDLLPVDTLCILPSEHQLCFQARSIRARLDAWRTILAGKRLAIGQAFQILNTHCLEKAKTESCAMGLKNFIALASKTGLGADLMRDADQILRLLADAEQAFRQLRYSSKQHSNAALVITLPLQFRQQLAAPNCIITLDEVLDELDKAVFGQLRSAEGPLEKQRLHQNATDERFRKAAEKQKQNANVHASSGSMEDPGLATPAPQGPAPLPAHTAVPNNTNSNINVFARIDWTKVGASSSHGRKIVASPDMQAAYLRAMRCGLISSKSTGASGIKNEPNSVVIIKISIPDAQGTSVDNRVSLVTRTTDPQSSQGSVYYTFTSAEKRH